MYYLMCWCDLNCCVCSERAKGGAGGGAGEGGGGGGGGGEEGDAPH